MATEVSVIETRLTADTDQHDKALAASEKKLSDFGKGASDAGMKSWTGKVGASIAQFGKQLESAGQGLTIGLTLPLVALGKQIVDVGFAYEKSMNVFQAVTKASADEMAKAAKVAQQLGADMTLPATSAADAASAMTELAKGGFTAAEAMDAARGALQLAAAASVSEAQAAEITANALNTFSLAATDATKVADLLAAASNASSAEITDIASSLQQAGASAAALHVPIEDLVTSIGLMANAGIKGSDAGTSLKTMMAALTPTTKGAAEAMKDLGIHAFDAKGNFVGFEEIIKQAAPALARMTDEQQALAIKVAFGSDAQRAANIILGQGVEKFNAMKDAVGQSGAAADLAAAKTKGLSGAWEGLKSQLETAALKAFEAVKGSLESVVRSIASAVEGLSKLDSSVVKAGLAFATVAASAGPIALMVGKLMTLGPQGAVTAAVIAGVALMAAAYTTNFAKMEDTLDSFAANLAVAFGGARKETGAWSQLLIQLGIIATESLDLILTGINQVVSALSGPVKFVIRSLKGDFEGANRALVEGFQQAAKAGEDFWTRTQQRGEEMRIVTEQGAVAYMDRLRIINSKGAQNAAEAYALGYVGTLKSQEGNFAAAGTSLGDYISKGVISGLSTIPKAVDGQLGPLKSKLHAAGVQAGAAFKSGVDSQWFKSPFFIVHYLEDAAKWASTQFPEKLKGAGAKAAEKFREAFQAKLGTINDWLGGVLNAGSLSEENFGIILRNFPKVAEEMDKASQSAKEFASTLQLYGTLMLTAEGRNTEFARSIDKLIGNFLQFHKTLREVMPLVSQYANLDTRKIEQATIITEDFSNAIKKSVGSLAEQTVAAKKAGDAAQRLADESFKHLLEVNEELSRQLPSSWNKILDAVVNSAGKQGAAVVALSNKYKAWAVDIIGVVDTLPGKFGDAARKVVSTVDQWVAFADKVLAVLHRMDSSIPASIGGIIEKMIGVFKSKKPDLEAVLDDVFGKVIPKSISSNQQAIEDSLDDLFGKVKPKAGEAGAASGGSFASGFLGQMAGIASGVATFFGSRGQGKIAGVVGGAMGGAQVGASIGAFFGPAGIGIGAGIGAIGGAILGLFGSGKSAAQKKAEEEAAKQAALQMEQTMLNIQSSILDVMTKGAELIEKISESSAMDLPRKAIKRFVNKLMLVLTEFVEQSKQFKIDAMQHAKAVSENLGGSIELMLGGAQLMEAIRTAEEVSDEKIKGFVATALKIISAWTDAAGEIELGAAKFAGKVSEKLKSSFELLRMIPDTIKGLLEASAIELTDEQIAKPIEMAKKVIDKFFALAEEFRGYALKQTVKSAEQFKSLFESTKSIFEALKMIGEYKPIEDSVFDAVTSDFAKITTWMDGLISTSAGWLTQADTLASNILDWAASLARSAGAVTAAMGGGTSLPGASMAATAPSGSRASSSSTTNITINGVQLNGDDPRTRAAVEALTSLFGMGGGMESMVGSYGG